MKGRGPTDRTKPRYFEQGLLLKSGGLAQLLGCCPHTASKIAKETKGFPPKRCLGRGREGWSRPEIEAWLLNPTAPPVETQK
jgi:predicted DNA-binding transcriptional regulator AlpA